MKKEEKMMEIIHRSATALEGTAFFARSAVSARVSPRHWGRQFQIVRTLIKIIFKDHTELKVIQFLRFICPNGGLALNFLNIFLF